MSADENYAISLLITKCTVTNMHNPDNTRAPVTTSYVSCDHIGTHLTNKYHVLKKIVDIIIGSHCL